MEWKKVSDTSFFFWVDDSVDVPEKYVKYKLKCNSNRYYNHLGVDIKAVVNTFVKAISDGKVFTLNGWAWWNVVMLSHWNWWSNYWHVKPLVSEWKKVKAWDIIWTITSTSHMNDEDHLHFGIYKIDKKNNFPEKNPNGYARKCLDKNNWAFVNPYDYLENSKHYILDDSWEVFYILKKFGKALKNQILIKKY